MARQRVAHANDFKSQGMQHALGRLLDGVNASSVETAEILLDVQQMSDLLSSLHDLRTGRLVNFNAAFGDL
jgi:hypothetical protein